MVVKALNYSLTFICFLAAHTELYIHKLSDKISRCYRDLLNTGTCFACLFVGCVCKMQELNSSFHVCFPSANVFLVFVFLHQPHTLLSLVSVQLAQGNVTGALALFRHILVTAVSSSTSYSSFAGCEQCRTSLPLLRCLQFYPFLYNLSHRQPCPRE